MNEPTIEWEAAFDKDARTITITIPAVWWVDQDNPKAALSALFLDLAAEVLQKDNWR